LAIEIGPVQSTPATLLIPVSTIPVAGLSDSFWSDALTFSIPGAVGVNNVTVWAKYDLTNHSLCLRFRGSDDTYDDSDAFNARLHIGTAGGVLDANCWWFYVLRLGLSASSRYNESAKNWRSSQYAWASWHLSQSSYWEAAFSIQVLLPRGQALEVRLWQQDVSLPPRTWRMSQPFPAGADLDLPNTWADVQLDRRTNLTISATPNEAGFDPILRRSSSEVVISGSLAPASVAAIAIAYTKPDGSTFTRVLITDATGSFSDTLSPDAVGTWYVSCSWAGTSDLNPSTSERISVNVSYSWLTAIGIAAVAMLLVAAVAFFVLRKRKTSAAIPPPPPP